MSAISLELRRLAKEAAQRPYADIAPAESQRGLVQTAWKKFHCVYLTVPPNRWVVGVFPADRLSAAQQFSDAVQFHFRHWLSAPRYHFFAPQTVQLSADFLDQLESLLNQEHAAGRPGLCPRHQAGQPGVALSLPKAPPPISAPMIQEQARLRQCVNALADTFAGFKDSNAQRMGRITTLLSGVVAQQSAIEETMRDTRSYLSRLSAKADTLELDKLLHFLASAPCNARGHVDRRELAKSLGASPEQLDRLFPPIALLPQRD